MYFLFVKKVNKENMRKVRFAKSCRGLTANMQTNRFRQLVEMKYASTANCVAVKMGSSLSWGNLAGAGMGSKSVALV